MQRSISLLWRAAVTASLQALALFLALFLALIPGPMSIHAQDAPAPLCRFGVNIFQRRVGDFDLAALRAGWYVDGWAWPDHPATGGALYAPVVQIDEIAAAPGYRYRPDRATLLATMAAHPGADWLIGNEPDRRQYQNDLLPATYARAYHELYTLIKEHDPSARVFAGNIVQPTPLRLQYLDQVLASYAAANSAPLPVDGWAIHNFILNEVHCTADMPNPDSCWGADVPPGSDALAGMVILPEDTGRMDLFVAQIERFRRWMADRGYRDRPLYISEYGQLLNADWGYTPAVVAQYLRDTYNYMLSATDPALGYPPDGGRLVQRFAWYANLTGAFNGALYETTAPNGGPPFALTDLGRTYQAYTAALTPTTAITVPLPGDLLMTSLTVDPPWIATQSDPITVTLTASVANQGAQSTPLTVTLDFTVAAITGAGTALPPLPAPVSIPLRGCGDAATVQVQWRNVETTEPVRLAVTARVHSAGDPAASGAMLTRELAVTNHWVAVPLVRTQPPR